MRSSRSSIVARVSPSQRRAARRPWGRGSARAGEDRLVGLFRIGSSSSAVTPPWLVSELVDVVGAGVVAEGVRRARSRDERRGAEAYYDAFAMEATLALGDEERAIELAERARAGLPDGEALLRARIDALRALALRRARGIEEALPAYELALQRDPGVFRRLGLAVPVRIVREGRDDAAEALADALARSPRFDVGAHGLVLRVSGDAASLSSCLEGGGGTILDCAEATLADVREERETTWSADEQPEVVSVDALVAFAARRAQERFFAPRIDLSQGDIGSLDGSNRVARDPLDGIRGHGPPP